MDTWKRILLFAIVRAIIAGIFSIAPKIYDILLQPKAKLVYRIIEGPGLNVSGKWRKVVSIDVSNSGKLSLNNIQTELIVKNGIIESSTIKESAGLQPVVSSDNSKITINVGNLHPSEQFTLSAMMLSNESTVDMVFNVRSDEVRGNLLLLESDQAKKDKGFLSGLLSGSSVFVMALFMLLSIRRGKLPFPLSRLMGFKQDILYYITIRNGLNELCENLSLTDLNLTYLHMADIFLAEGLRSNEYKERSINALKCLLLIKNMAETSKNVVIDDLRILEGDSFSENSISVLLSKSVDVGNISEVRKRIEDFLPKGLDS